MRRNASIGFTLAELLIALAILGIIATFTIPKILSVQQNSKFKSIAKESIGTVSAAYSTYKLKNPVNGNTNILDLTPSLNYVKVEPTAMLDGLPVASGWPATWDCSTSSCLRLHNGSVLAAFWMNFAGTATTNAVYFIIDPDGVQTGNRDSVIGVLYYNGKVRTWGTAEANSTCSDGTFGPGDPTQDPAWFNWN